MAHKKARPKDRPPKAKMENADKVRESTTYAESQRSHEPSNNRTGTSLQMIRSK